MSLNASSSLVLTLGSLGISQEYIYPVFLLGTLTYLFIMFCNLLVFMTIALSKRLHKPMFILLLNLPISDMIGATAFLPHLVFSIVTQNRLISHPACVTQAFFLHVYGTGNFLVLSAMAYDRYAAICSPLRYNTIMNPQNLIRIILLLWLINISLTVSYIALSQRLIVCRIQIIDLFCNNPSLLKLTCEDITLNSYYTLFFMVLVQGVPLVIILYTYGQILRTCLMTNQADARRKAIQTCGSHLIVYSILEFNTFITLMAHRIQNASSVMRKALGVSVLIVPVFFNPIIYGLNTSELKRSAKMLLMKKVVSSKMRPGLV